MEDTVRSGQGGTKELPSSTETKLTTLNSGEDVSGKTVRQRAPPGRAWRWRWLDEVRRGVVGQHASSCDRAAARMSRLPRLDSHP